MNGFGGWTVALLGSAALLAGVSTGYAEDVCQEITYFVRDTAESSRPVRPEKMRLGGKMSVQFPLSSSELIEFLDGDLYLFCQLGAVNSKKEEGVEGIIGETTLYLSTQLGAEIQSGPTLMTGESGLSESHFIPSPFDEDLIFRGDKHWLTIRIIPEGKKKVTGVAFHCTLTSGSSSCR